MKKESIVTAVLSGAAVILLVGAAAGIILRDRTAPVISLEEKNTLTYTEGESYEVILKNMKAEDDKDGDVTGSLRVSNIYVTSRDRATVVYVAKDRSNNIGKLKREVRYQEAIPVEEPVHDVEDQETVEETQENTEANQNNNQTGNQEQNAPKILMLKNEASLKVGENFNIYRYIQRAVDENGNDISRSMHIEGTYDMTKAGVYELKLYVVNAAGVRSQTETFTLTVTE